MRSARRACRRSLTTGLFRGATLNLNRFTGPGKVGMRSMYLHLPSSKE